MIEDSGLDVIAIGPLYCRDKGERSMKKILVIATGGTIASKEKGNGLEPEATGEELLAGVPDLPEGCRLDTLQLMNIDSTNMCKRQWEKIRDTILEKYQEYDGFVILHGTDTLAYTAAILSYLIQGSEKPIVLTGSQMPMDHSYTDVKINIYQSVIYALDEDSHEVSIVFNGKAIAGTRGKKQRTRSFHAFDSINFPPLASIYGSKVERTYPAKPFSGKLRVSRQIDDRVFLLKLTPGIRPDIFRALTESYDAVILETFGIGGIPCGEDGAFEAALFDWVKGGKTLAVTTQVMEEGCDLGVYQVGKRFSEDERILQAGNMTTEAVLAKLMWILGETKDTSEIHRLFYRTVNHDR